MNDLRIRVITGVIAVSIVIPALVFSPYGVWLLCVVVSMMAMWEFLRLTRTEAPRYRIAALAMGGLMWATALLSISPIGWTIPREVYWLEAIMILPVLQILVLFDPGEPNPAKPVGGVMLGFLYCLMPMYLLFDLSVPTEVAQYSFHLPLGYLLLTWALDVAAYFVGRFLGKHLLFERISPKKTWEGAIGGAAFCLFWGWVNTQILPVSTFNWLIIAGIVAVFGQLGDLVESMFKRSMQVKDSGGILPGHGGMLDRFDGTFLAVPFVYLYFSLL
jgi:phosphatidate cytidylyltransferase